jgi:exodeoxyribonuclease-3
MKIITWNVNGIRAVERKCALQELTGKYSPDILFLQEIKGKREQFSKYLTKNEEYEQFYHSAEKPGYAGTGIWVEGEFFNALENVEFKTSVPKAPNMDEGRVSHLFFMLDGKKYDLLSIYFPNGGKSDDAWKEKLMFFDRVLDYMNDLRERGHEVIVGGDMNVAHKEVDLARPKENDGNIGFHPDERAWMDKVMVDNWSDVWRSKNPKALDIYSWWDMKTRARDRNVGWRIDYFFMDKNSSDNIKEIRYLNEQIGSDHCPLLLEI